MDPNYTSSGQQTDDQAQVVTAEPPVTQPPPGAAPQRSQGPFSAYLDPSQTREPTHTASQQRPSGFMGTGGRISFLADQLLGGIAKGRADAYNRSLQQQAYTYKRLDSAAKDISENPNLTDADKQGLLNRLYQFKAAAVAGAIDPSSAEGGEKKKSGKSKDGGDKQANPVVNFIHQAALRLAGPGAQPQAITPQSVNQVLGEVYSAMSQKTGAAQQLGSAWANVVKSVGNAAKKGVKNEAEFMADPDVQAAISQYAPLAGEKGHKAVLDLFKGTANTLNSTRVDVEMTDGTVVPGNRLRDGTITGSNGNVLPPASIKSIGTNLRPKLNDIHWQDQNGDWHLGKEDAQGNKFTEDGKPLNPKDITDVSKTGPKPEKFTGELGTRLAAQKILDNPHSTPSEIKQAKAELKKLDAAATSITIRNEVARENTGTPPTPGVTGEDVLKNQPDKIKALVKAVASYQMKLPSGFALKSHPWVDVAELVPRYRPDWKQYNYDIAQHMRTDYTNTKGNATGAKILSLNTLTQHLGNFEEATKAMQSHDVRAFNSAINAVRTATGDPKVTNLDTAKTAISDELATALKQSGATDVTIQHWRSGFDAASSPAQFKGAIQEGYNLMAGRLKPIKEEYEGVIGTLDVPIVHPSSKPFFRKHGIDPDTLEPIRKTAEPPSGGRPPLSSFEK